MSRNKMLLARRRRQSRRRKLAMRWWKHYAFFFVIDEMTKAEFAELYPPDSFAVSSINEVGYTE